MTTSVTMNINTLLEKLVVIVSDTIGSDLAQIKANTSGQTRPAIIRSRGTTTGNGSTNQPNVELPYPYCSIDYVQSDLWGNKEVINQYIKEDGNYVYEADVLVKLSIDIIGRTQNNVHTIGNKFQRYLAMASIRDKIENLMGARLFHVSSLKKGTIPRSSEWVDMSSLTIQVIIRDVLTTDSDGNIIQIALDGELHKVFEDPNPTIINIDTGV